MSRRSKTCWGLLLAGVALVWAGAPFLAYCLLAGFVAQDAVDG